MMTRSFIPSLIVSLAFLFSLPLTADAQQPLSAEDIANIESVGATVLSPNGETIAYTLSVPRTDDEPVGTNYSELYLIDASGGDPVPVVERPVSAASPQWGDDGRLYFAATLEEHHSSRQVYSVNESGSDLQRHTDADHGVGSYAWSPDGNWLAWSASDPVPQDLQEKRDRGYDMIVVGEDEQYTRLWIQPRDGEAEVVTPADLFVRDFEWSPASDRLLLRSSDRPGPDEDFMYSRIDVIDREGEKLYEIMTSPKKKGMMSWSPDGSRVAILAGKVYSDPLAQRIWVASADGSDKRDYTPRDWEGTPEWISWKNDETLLFNAVVRSSTKLYRYELGTKELATLAGGDEEIFRSVSLSADGERFAAAVNTWQQPNEVYTYSFSDGSFERLTWHNEWFADRDLGRQSSITWKGADGLEIEGVLIKPVGYTEGERYPMAILPHGGPEGISMNGWNTRPLYPSQLLSGEGYVVFKPNYRGSGGRGTWFASANHRDLGGKEFDDVLLGIDHLDKAGLIDPDRVGISGTSYGGYFSAWAATRHSDRFAAGITFAGLSNWISFTGTTDIPHEMSVVHWDLYWFDNPGQHWDRSPVAWLNHADTPLLVATGLADTRVHPEQSIQLYQFLKMKGVPTGLVLYPRQPHGLTERAHRLDFMHRVANWFNEHVK